MTTGHREWDASSYAKVSAPQQAWGQKVLERLTLRGDERALDVGCGGGAVTEELLGRLSRGRVVGLDASANMIEEATRRLGTRFRDRVSFRCGDALDLADERAFDVIFSTATFHWVPDHDKLFRVLHRALVPGGILLAQCGGAGNLDVIRAAGEEIASAEPFRQWMQGFEGPWVYATAEETRRRMEAAGFTDIETGLEPAPTPFADGQVFREFLRTVIFRVHLTRLPDEALRTRYLDALVAWAARRSPPFTLDYVRLNLTGRRAG